MYISIMNKLNIYLNRVFALIILFTPFLGLFDTLHHGRLAAMSVWTNSMEAFDYDDDGRIITFEDAWNQFRIDDSFDFVEIPALAILAMMLTMFVFHMFASTCILKLSLRARSIFSIAPHGFYTIISPPLHYDWEFFYRQSNEEKAIVKCWKRQVETFSSYCQQLSYSAPSSPSSLSRTPETNPSWNLINFF